MLINILVAILIGGLAGWLAGLIRRGQGYGFFANILIGIFGSVLGSLLFWLIGVETDTFLGNLFVATLGAILLLAILNLFKR